jgi:hypothetical protein
MDFFFVFCLYKYIQDINDIKKCHFHSLIKINKQAKTELTWGDKCFQETYNEPGQK